MELIDAQIEIMEALSERVAKFAKEQEAIYSRMCNEMASLDEAKQILKLREFAQFIRKEVI